LEYDILVPSAVSQVDEGSKQAEGKDVRVCEQRHASVARYGDGERGGIVNERLAWISMDHHSVMTGFSHQQFHYGLGSVTIQTVYGTPWDHLQAIFACLRTRATN
jgi:hypothetical protein